MSKLRAGVGEAYYSIKKWRGVNENPDGDTNLQDGEAAVMRNFRITDGGALKKRPGSAIVAGLMNGYTVHADTGTELLLRTDVGTGEDGPEMWPGVEPDSVGLPVPYGEGMVIPAVEAGEHIGWYARPTGGELYQLGRVEHTPVRAVPSVDTDEGYALTSYTSAKYDRYLYMLLFDEPPVFRNGTWDLSRGVVSETWPDRKGWPVGKYAITREGSDWPETIRAKPGVVPAAEEFTDFNTTGRYMKCEGTAAEMTKEYGEEEYLVDLYGGWNIRWAWTVFDSPKYEWYFRPIYSQPNEAGTVVKSLWSGYVGGNEYIVAACNHYLWSLAEKDGAWSKQAIGVIDTDGHVCLFGFAGKLYCLDGSDYYSWDGKVFARVEGYVPLVAVAAPPSGGGTLLERVNLLTPKRRQRFSPDGAGTVFQLAESGLASVDSVTLAGEPVAADSYTVDLNTGSVTFTKAPAEATDNLEVSYTVSAEDGRAKLAAMRFSELYNGVNDSRVFLYGDGSNVTYYSDLDGNGVPTAEYFPEMNEIAVGDENTPLTALIRMYNRLMAYKLGSAWSIYYDSITLEDGTVTAGFYCNAVNRSLGHDACGQICLVENRPRTLDGRSIYEWKASSGSGSITNDQRNAERISQKVENTLGGFDLGESLVFYDKINHEYYCVHNGTAVVQNTENGAWYVYTAFPATAMIVYDDELYYGTADGYLRKFSDDYTSDNGKSIDAYWESGSMSFGRDYMEKYSPSVWVGLKQEESAAVTVGIETDRMEAITAEVSLSNDADAMPRMNRTRLKAKKFTYYKLIFLTDSPDTRCTVVASDVRVKFNINVK